MQDGNSSEQNRQSGPGSQQQNQQQQQQQQEQMIQLDAQTYQALLDHLEDLEKRVQEASSSSNNSQDDDLDDLDALANEGRRSSANQQEGPSLEDMSREQFLQFTLQQISEGVVTPIAVALEEIKLQQEIDRLTRDEKYSDFWDYKDEIYRIAKDNPKLSLKKVYRLAKEEAGEKKPTGERKGDRESLLRHLPKPPQGEKPGGIPAGATETKEPETRREAAEKAFDEVMKGREE